MIGLGNYKALVSIAGSVALVGCASIDDSHQPFLDRQDMERRMVELESDRASLVAGKPLVQDIDTPFLGTADTLQVLQTAGLPPHLEQHIEWFDSRPLVLHEVADRIQQQTGIRTRVRGEMPEDSPVLQQTMTGSYANADDVLLSTLGTNGPAPIDAIRVDHNGTLTSLLNKIATRFGVSWDYTRGEIRFSYHSTRTFQIAALPGGVTQTASLSNNSGGAGSGDDYVSAAGGLSTSYTSATDPWAAIDSSISAIIGNNGEYTVNPGSSSVMVTARKSTMEDVEDYINSLNEIYLRQVALEVNVYTLQMSEDDSKGFSLNAAYRDLASNYGLSIDALPGQGDTIGNQFTASVLEGDSRFNGSELLFDALNQWGDASIVTSASGVVLNGQPFPVQDVNRQSYLASAETTFQDGISSTSLEPGEVTTGFSMQVLPQILDSNDLLLQYSFTLSMLNNIQEFSSGDNTIQLPDVDDRSFTQRTKMPMNSTLVLAGYQRDEDTLNRRAGVGGFNRSKEQLKTMIFVAISAARQ